MQLALYGAGGARGAGQARKAGEAPDAGSASEARRMCAACQAREARYGFRDGGSGDTSVDRPRTLCFDCFRMEIDRRRVVAAQLARGWNATQAALPLSGTLEALRRQRGRAQIAARHALALR